jgi:Co/Zn/Cd efflux system component
LGQHCCSHETKSGSIDPQWRRALWIALVINAGMFLVEMVAGAAADSRALYADALDFFSDAANYAISLGVAGLALVWRARVALMLYRFRTGDANMQSVWICSRNDAIGNIAVVAAAIGVFGTGTAWPDLAVATIMAALGISGGWSILRLARAELRGEKERRVSPA